MKTLFILLFITPFLSISQTKGDIGFIYNSYNLNRINIDYRKPLGEKYKLVIGGVIGSLNTGYWSKGDLVYGSDSLITFRNSISSSFQVGLKIGAERKLSKLFSIGTGVMLAYRDQKNNISKTNYVFNDSTNTWDIDNNTSMYGFDNSNISKVRRAYFVPQLQVSFSMDLPIVERLYLNLFIGGLFSFPVFMSESQKNDPFKDYQTPSKTTNFEMSNQAGIGLRYAL